MEGKDFRDALRSGKSVYSTLLISSFPGMFDMIISLGKGRRKHHTAQLLHVPVWR
jgi:hypothetical protein